MFHAVAAIDEVNRRDRVPAVRAAAVTDGIRALRALDSWHLAEVAASRQAFYAATSIGERESIRAHRRELAELVDDCAGLVITGGHVGVLLPPAARVRPGDDDQEAADHLVCGSDGAVGPGGAVRRPPTGASRSADRGGAPVHATHLSTQGAEG